MDRKIAPIINEYGGNLRGLGIRPEKIILFGSSANGRLLKDSDLDLAVISKDFSGMDLWERACILGRARVGLKWPMEILGLSPDEFENAGKGSFIGDEVKTKGIDMLKTSAIG
ncbi:MAG: nucleotidyltransferase domain-containing protein [bacterium]